MESQAEIEAYNTRELWRDVENHLRIAVECIEHVQETLEDDLNLGAFAVLLDEQKDALRRARNDAAEKIA